MSITIEVAPEVESAIEIEAIRRGLTPEQCAGEVLSEALCDLEWDRQDAEEARAILAASDPTQRRTLAELKQALSQKVERK